MRLSIGTFLLLGVSFVLLPKAVEGNILCNTTYYQTDAGALSFWSLYDDADAHLPTLPIDPKCRLAVRGSADVARVFRWYSFRAPGNSSVTYDMVAKDKSSDPTTLAVYVGDDCDALTCEQTATEGTSGTTNWTAVGGVTYRILATRAKPDPDASAGTVHRFEFQGGTPMSLCELNLANYPPSQHKQSCSCSASNNVPFKNAAMQCADDCANCHEEEDGSGNSFCYYPSLEWYYSSDATIGSTGGKECFTFADGFDADVVATTVCRDVEELEDSGNSDCTLSFETGAGTTTTCPLCTYNPSASCGSEAAYNGDFPFADCGGGNIFSPCGGIGLTGVYADYEKIVLARDEGGTPGVGECLGGSIDAADALTTIDMEMDVFTDAITLQGYEKQLYRLPVNSTIHNNVMCVFYGTTGDPDLRIRANSPDAGTKCSETRGGATQAARQGECAMTIYDDETALYIEVEAFTSSGANVSWVYCTPYDYNLYIASTTGFDIAADETKWLRLGVEGRDNQTIGCTLEGTSGGDPDLALHLDNKNGEANCRSEGGGTSEYCEVTIPEMTESLFVAVYDGSFTSTPIDGLSVRCVPVNEGADEFIELYGTSKPFNLSTTPIRTFALEMYGEFAFCDLRGDDGEFINNTDIDFYVEIGSPPDVANDAASCKSGDFFSDQEVCFAAGSPYNRDVVYVSVVSHTSADDTNMALRCVSPSQLRLNSTTYDFYLGEDQFRSFVLDVPSDAESISCRSEADDGGDVDLWIKVGLDDWQFDCIANNATSFETCTVAVETTTDEEDPETVFVLAYGYNATNSVNITCVADIADEEEEVETTATSKSGNPDDPIRKLSKKLTSKDTENVAPPAMKFLRNKSN